MHRADLDEDARRGDEGNNDGTSRAGSGFHQFLFHGSPIAHGVCVQFIFHDGCICQLRRGGARRPRRLVESGLSRRLFETGAPSSIRRRNISHMLPWRAAHPRSAGCIATAWSPSLKYVPSVKPGASLPVSQAAAVAAVVVGALMILVLEVLVVAGGVPPLQCRWRQL